MINIADFLLTVVSSAATSSALVALILWLTKSWIGERLKNAIRAEYDTKLESHKAQLKAEYDQKLETHKAQLKSQSDVELEKLKSSLAIAASEQNTTFSGLHERRTDVVAKTYALLQSLHSCVADYTAAFELPGDSPRSERLDRAAKAFNEFNPYITQNQIFLPKRIAEVVANVNQELRKITNRFTILVDRPNNPNYEEWIKLTEKLEIDIQDAFKKLEDELRSTLGDRG